MTQPEARDALLEGATKTNSEFVTIQRKTLLIALGDEEAKDGEELSER